MLLNMESLLDVFAVGTEMRAENHSLVVAVVKQYGHNLGRGADGERRYAYCKAGVIPLLS